MSFNRMKRIVFLTISFLLVFASSNLFSQSLKWQFGNNLTNYNYISSNGNKIDYLLPNDGLNMSIFWENRILDTVSLRSEALLNSNLKLLKKYNFYQSKPTLAKIISSLSYDIGLAINQLNAVGSTQNIPISYRTNYLTFLAGIGPNIKLPSNFSLSIKAKTSLSKLLSGNQLLNSTYYKLDSYEKFNQLQWMLGYEVSLAKKLNSNFSGFISYQSAQTFHKNAPGEGSLNFQTNTLSIGIAIHK